MLVNCNDVVCSVCESGFDLFSFYKQKDVFNGRKCRARDALKGYSNLNMHGHLKDLVCCRYLNEINLLPSEKDRPIPHR